MISTRLSQPPVRPRLYRRLLWAVLGTGLVLTGVGTAGWWGITQATPERGQVPVAIPPEPPREQSALSAKPAMLPAAPTRLSLPSLQIDAPVRPVGTGADRALQVPADPSVLGWWEAGARPGLGVGTIVIAGHVDGARTGPGALYRLREARPGEVIRLDSAHGSHDYAVRGLRSFSKNKLPAELFTTEGRPRLVLITCGGTFDPNTRQYQYNIVVYATPS